MSLLMKDGLMEMVEERRRGEESRGKEGRGDEMKWEEDRRGRGGGGG